MNLLLKSVLTLSAFLLLGFVSNAQTTSNVVKMDATVKWYPSNCDPTNCNPEECKKLVEAGICTPEQVTQCKAKATTKVASHKMVDTELISAVLVNQESTQVASKVKSKKCCASAGCAKKM